VIYVAEGFDDFVNGATTHTGKRYMNDFFVLDPSNTTNFSVTTGRHGSSALAISSSSAQFRLTSNIGLSGTIFLGFAIKRTNDDGTEPAFLRLVANDGTNSHLELKFSGSTGSGLKVVFADGSNASATGVFPINTWVWLSVGISFGDSGYVYVKNNNLTNILFQDPGDTRYGSDTSVRDIRFVIGPITYHLDDLFVADGTGGIWNDYIPDFEIHKLNVNGFRAGSQGFGSSSYTSVTTADDDGSYDRDSVLGTNYLIADTTDTGGMTNIRGIAVNSRYKINDSTTRAIMHRCYDGSTFAPIGSNYWTQGTGSPTGYQSYQSIAVTSLFTGSNWTSSEIDSMAIVFESQLTSTN
jgi:hypothetical protein